MVNGCGALNTGTLVKTWGTVMYVDTAATPTFSIIDDGSGIGDSSGIANGLRVDLPGPPYTIVPPAINSVAAVTGISSSDSAANTVYAVLRPRTQRDISLYSSRPGPPSVTIWSPAAGCHVADNPEPERGSLRYCFGIRDGDERSDAGRQRRLDSGDKIDRQRISGNGYYCYWNSVTPAAIL